VRRDLWGSAGARLCPKDQSQHVGAERGVENLSRFWCGDKLRLVCDTAALREEGRCVRGSPDAGVDNNILEQCLLDARTKTIPGEPAVVNHDVGAQRLEFTLQRVRWHQTGAGRRRCRGGAGKRWDLWGSAGLRLCPKGRPQHVGGGRGSENLGRFWCGDAPRLVCDTAAPGRGEVSSWQSRRWCGDKNPWAAPLLASNFAWECGSCATAVCLVPSIAK